MPHPYDEDDPNFVPDLLKSRKVVHIAARWLMSLGYNVKVRPTRIRPDPTEMSRYADDGDLVCVLGRLEVKQRPSIAFSSVHEFPYPSIIVDACHIWDRAQPKPYAYLIFDNDCSHCYIIKGTTRSRWARKFRWDREKKRLRCFYECPLSCCICVEIPHTARIPAKEASA
jgi:hypothetical protein